MSCLPAQNLRKNIRLFGGYSNQDVRLFQNWVWWLDTIYTQDKKGDIEKEAEGDANDLLQVSLSILR